uniref:Uncharacterized protein n=1 Tax=Poteriospumella lacustris TaxID=1117027 RepID=A0A7S6TCK9_9STRA|nr:hypothetical protein PoterioPt_p035 [Poteriospumella lacustris]
MFLRPPRLNSKKISIFCLGLEPYFYAASFVGFLKFLLKNSTFKFLFFNQNSKKLKTFLSFFFAIFESFVIFRDNKLSLKTSFFYFKILVISCSSLILALSVNFLDNYLEEKAISVIFLINFISWKLSEKLLSFNEIFIFILLQLSLILLKNLQAIIQLVSISQLSENKTLNLSFLKIRPHEIGNIPIFLAFFIYNCLSGTKLMEKKFSFFYFCFLVSVFIVIFSLIYFNYKKLTIYLKKRSLLIVNKLKLIKSDKETEIFLTQKIFEASVAYIFILNSILILLRFLFKELIAPLKEIENTILEHFFISNMISDLLLLGSKIYFENKFEKLNFLIIK